MRMCVAVSELLNGLCCGLRVMNDLLNLARIRACSICIKNKSEVVKAEGVVIDTEVNNGGGCDSSAVLEPQAYPTLVD